MCLSTWQMFVFHHLFPNGVRGVIKNVLSKFSVLCSKKKSSLLWCDSGGTENPRGNHGESVWVITPFFIQTLLYSLDAKFVFFSHRRMCHLYFFFRVITLYCIGTIFFSITHGEPEPLSVDVR